VTLHKRNPTFHVSAHLHNLCSSTRSPSGSSQRAAPASLPFGVVTQALRANLSSANVLRGRNGLRRRFFHHRLRWFASRPGRRGAVLSSWSKCLNLHAAPGVRPPVSPPAGSYFSSCKSRCDGHRVLSSARSPNKRSANRWADCSLQSRGWKFARNEAPFNFSYKGETGVIPRELAVAYF